MTAGETVHLWTALALQYHVTASRTDTCALACHSFSSDTGYVLPGFFVDTTDQDRVKFSIVISSENLLLNLYRAFKSPRLLTIALDHTYRILTDDHPTLLIGVAAPGNHAPTLVLVPVNTQSHVSLHSAPDIHATVADAHIHIVAFAISHSEDEESTVRALEMVKQEVYKIVRFRSLAVIRDTTSD
jgi:hypothetical protein